MNRLYKMGELSPSAPPLDGVLTLAARRERQDRRREGESQTSRPSRSQALRSPQVGRGGPRAAEIVGHRPQDLVGRDWRALWGLDGEDGRGQVEANGAQG